MKTMLDTVEELDQLCNHPQALGAIDCKLYIVGSVIREGTRTSYEEEKTYEILINNAVREFLIDSAQKTLSFLKEREFYEINEVEDGGDNIIQYIAIPHLSDLERWQNQQNLDASALASTVLNRDDFKPKAYMCRFEIGEKRFFLLKSISQSALLKPYTRMLRLNRGQYEIDEDANKRLFIDEHWDAFSCDDYAALINEKKVLAMFKYYESVREAAQDRLSEIGALNFIDDLGALMNFVDGKVLLQKKLARATSNNIDDAGKVRLIQLIRDGTIQLQLNEQNKIVCTNAEEMRIVLDVLLDNYMKSMISEEKYKAINKTRLQR